MNRDLINKAITGISSAFLEEAMTSPARETAPERTKNMGKFENRQRGTSSRRIVTVALAACLIFALAVTAYAANIFGLRELYNVGTRQLPEEAVPYIQENSESASQEGLSARVTESLCSNGKLMATVEISGGDKYILCEQWYNQEDPASLIGIQGDQTLQEYADSQGKTLLFVGVFLDGENFGSAQSFVAKYDGSGNLTMLADADMTGEVTQAVCRVNAENRADPEAPIQRLEIPFSVTPMPSSDREFVPDDPDAIPGMILGNATVNDSPLGMTIRWPETVTDIEQFQNVMKEEIEDCEFRESGSIQTEDGNYCFTANMVQGTIGDSFTVKFYDWDKEFIGQVVFTKK